MNTRGHLRGFGMDGFLALIIAMVIFAFLIFFTSRSVKTIMVVGLALAGVLILRAFGILG